MLRKIKLYGKLAKFIGKRVLEADVASAAEAIRFLIANWPELEQHMAQQYYRVSLDDYDLTGEELHDPAGKSAVRITPVVAGAGTAGRILLGVALIAASFFTAGASIGLLGLAKPLLVSSALSSIGVTLVLGGVAQLLSPVPKLDATTEQDPRRSYSFSGIQNSSRPGTPVPVVYGEVLVGSVVISAALDTVQVSV